MKHWKILCMLMTLISILLLILAACTVSSPTSTPSGESLAALNTIPVSRVATDPVPLPTTPSASPTKEMTPTPTVQPAAIETPAGILLPPDEDILEQVLWLYETNNGCQLPCWWGITPGQTEWAIAEEFLLRFDQDISESTGSTGVAAYEVRIPLPLEVFWEDHTSLHILVQNGIVERMRTYVSIGDPPPGYLTQYELSAFLTTYGQPSEVWLSTYSSTFENNDLPFRVVLFYPEQGITVLYSDNGVSQEGIVSGCPQKGPASYVRLDAPDLDLTFEEVISNVAVFNTYYLPLEETTEIDVATFYQIFRDPDNTTCLETPASLWVEANTFP
jgi:hypothetical protein